MTGIGPVPDHLAAVSWMDGAHGQIKQITSEENLKKEAEIKIILGNTQLLELGLNSWQILDQTSNQ